MRSKVFPDSQRATRHLSRSETRMISKGVLIAWSLPRLSVTARSWKIIHVHGFFDTLLLLSWKIMDGLWQGMAPWIIIHDFDPWFIHDEPCLKFRSKSKIVSYCVSFCLLFCLLFLRVTLMARVALRTLFGTTYPEAARWVRFQIALGGLLTVLGMDFDGIAEKRLFSDLF